MHTDRAFHPTVICGYPRSGNTWLTGMVNPLEYYSKTVLSFPGSRTVAENVLDLDKPDALAKFRSLDRTQLTGVVLKTHQPPSKIPALLQLSLSELNLIYIFRSPMQVAISSFFYSQKARPLTRTAQPGGNLIEDIHERFNQYALEFSRLGGSANFLESFGSYIEHLRSAVEVSGLPQAKTHIVQYEDLYFSTVYEMLKLNKHLGFQWETGAITHVVSRLSIEDVNRLQGGSFSSSISHSQRHAMFKEMIVNMFIETFDADLQRIRSLSGARNEM